MSLSLSYHMGPTFHISNLSLFFSHEFFKKYVNEVYSNYYKTEEVLTKIRMVKKIVRNLECHAFEI